MNSLQLNNKSNRRYPIGEFNFKSDVSVVEEATLIKIIQDFPTILRSQVENMTKIDPSKKWLFYCYREGGWSIQQVIHHCADSHMNGFIRCKLALTENAPSIKPYLEHQWAELNDVTVTDIEHSLNILAGVHARWKVLFSVLSPEEFKKTFFHPEMEKVVSLKEQLQIYAWHSQHHFAHIKLAFSFPIK